MVMKSLKISRRQSKVISSQPNNLTSPYASGMPPTGSPFVVGRPIRPEEKIYGREEVFREITDLMATFSCANVIGSRRMGKTSVLNHLIAHKPRYLPHYTMGRALLLARIDLQDSVSNAERFYGAALRELLTCLSREMPDKSQEFTDLLLRLEKVPEASYDEFHASLRQLRGRDKTSVAPVLIVDEFEGVLSSSSETSFPYPKFFDGLRSLIGTHGLMAMVVATKAPLIEYFSEPFRPKSLTSTFPNYFQPVVLKLLDENAAKKLLSQPSPYLLSQSEIKVAREWAGGHPCHLQVAGEAIYRAKADGKTMRWASKRFHEIKRQSCFVGDTNSNHGHYLSWIAGGVLLILGSLAFRYRSWGELKLLLWALPVRIGHLAQDLGGKIDQIAAWTIGVMFISLIILIYLRVLKLRDLGIWIRKILGLGGG